MLIYFCLICQWPILINEIQNFDDMVSLRSEKNKKNIKRKRKRKLVKDDLVDMQGRMQQMKKP